MSAQRHCRRRAQDTEKGLCGGSEFGPQWWRRPCAATRVEEGSSRHVDEAAMSPGPLASCEFRGLADGRSIPREQKPPSLLCRWVCGGVVYNYVTTPRSPGREFSLEKNCVSLTASEGLRTSTRRRGGWNVPHTIQNQSYL